MGGKWLRNNVNCCTDKYCVTTSHRIYPQGMNCLVRKVRPFWHRRSMKNTREHAIKKWVVRFQLQRWQEEEKGDTGMSHWGRTAHTSDFFSVEETRCICNSAGTLRINILDMLAHTAVLFGDDSSFPTTKLA